MRIAIGGSAANPPHIGHLTLLNRLRTSGKFNMIIWIPSGTSKDKQFGPDISPDDRVAMTELMIPQEWRLEQPKLIIRYTDVYGENVPAIEHLEKLQSQNRYAMIQWYTGTDQDVSTWHRGKELVDNWDFYYIGREGYVGKQRNDVNGVLPDISSSDIRQRIRERRPFEHLVPPKVAEYIKVNGLYRNRE